MFFFLPGICLCSIDLRCTLITSTNLILRYSACHKTTQWTHFFLLAFHLLKVFCHNIVCIWHVAVNLTLVCRATSCPKLQQVAPARYRRPAHPPPVTSDYANPEVQTHTNTHRRFAMWRFKLTLYFVANLCNFKCFCRAATVCPRSRMSLHDIFLFWHKVYEPNNSVEATTVISKWKCPSVCVSTDPGLYLFSRLSLSAPSASLYPDLSLSVLLIGWKEKILPQNFSNLASHM